MGKAIDWKSYNRNLINRGQITFWFSPEVMGDWVAIPWDVHAVNAKIKANIFFINILCIT